MLGSLENQTEEWAELEGATQPEPQLRSHWQGQCLSPGCCSCSWPCMLGSPCSTDGSHWNAAPDTAVKEFSTGSTSCIIAPGIVSGVGASGWTGPSAGTWALAAREADRQVICHFGFYRRKQSLWLMTLKPIPTDGVCGRGEFLYTTKQFSNTLWVSYNSTNSDWNYLPRVSIGVHRLRPQSYKTVLHFRYK